MRTSRLRPIALGLLLAAGHAGSANALDPLRATSQYVVAKWSAESGLPSNSVHALRQTRDRYLWLGTGAGLVRFDGARFVLFNARNTPQFGAGGVTSLNEGADGSLYFGTVSGAVIQYRNGSFVELLPRTGTGPVESLLPARDGSLWIALLGRPVFRWANERATSLLPQLDAMGPHVLAEDERGAIWIGTRRLGLVHFQGGEIRRYGVADGLPSDTIQALLVDRAGSLWIGTPQGLSRLREGRIERFMERDGLSHKNVSALLEDHDGVIWIGTSGGGLDRLRDGRFSSFTTRDGLSDDNVRCLLEDHEGSLWVGTADGLNRLSEGRFIAYGHPEGLQDDAVRAVAEGAGGVWIGTSSGRVARLRDGGVEQWPRLGPDPIISMFEDRDGTLWLGDDAGRLIRLEHGALTDQTPAEARQNWKVPAITEDAEGPLFFVTGLGLSRLHGRHFVPLHPGAPALGYVHRIHRDRAGTLWLCGSKGLAQVTGDQYRLFSQKDGLPHDRVRWLSEDDDGGLWLVTVGGLAHLRDGVVRKVTIEQGLPEDYLRLALDDGRGHLWIASMGHIFRLDKQEIADVFAGKAARVSPVSFDTSDGLRTTETLLSSSPGFRGHDGRLWFATAKGVSTVDPSRMSTDDAAPEALIEAVTIDKETGRREVYPPGRGEVLIEYTALSFRSAGKLLFRYRMEDFDRDWVEAGPRRAAYYSNLPPGRYRFSVMASNRDGIWNGRATSFSFTVRPPFFRTLPFYLASAAVLGGLGVGAHRMRVRQVGARFAAIIGERTRIARELHDTLAQGLAGVGIQIDTALRTAPSEPELARRHMQLARAMVRSSLAEVRGSIWALRAQTSKGRDGLGAALSESLAQLTADTGLDFNIRVGGRPRPLSAEVERNLLRIAHEAVTNAVRHAAARRVDVALDFQQESVHFCVRDDGCGFDADAFVANPGGRHFGLLGISERARALGGEVRLQSRPGEGTEVACRLPYHGGREPLERDGESGEGADL